MQANISSDAIGVSLKAKHYQDILVHRPKVDFFEIHAENYMMADGPHHDFLSEIAAHYPISLHGVGMSLGSADGIDADHLAQFKRLAERYSPALISEHLAWSVNNGQYLADLLPIPLTEESLEVVCTNICRMQDALSRQVLVENPSNYLSFEHSTIQEEIFLSTVVDRTGCGLLLDVNNVFVSSQNLDLCAQSYLTALPELAVKEIHLSGHVSKSVEGVNILIDTHGSQVTDQVWALYNLVIKQISRRPTLIEWDSNIPSLEVLVAEAEKARNPESG